MPVTQGKIVFVTPVLEFVDNVLCSLKLVATASSGPAVSSGRINRGELWEGEGKRPSSLLLFLCL